MSLSYRNIFKATLTLSSAQVVEAFVSLIRAKFIAVWLGPAGIAVNSILLTTLNTMSQLASLGLPQSAVRDISQANSQHDSDKLNRVVSVVFTAFLVLAVAALAVCMLASPLLSKMSFGGSSDYTVDFCIVAVGLAFMLLANINIAMLQGCQKLRYLAKTSIFSACISICICLPLYYWLGIRGVACSITIGYILTFLFSMYYKYKSSLRQIWLPASVVMRDVTPMLKLGVVIMIASLLINLFTYVTNSIICTFGSLEDVGYYQAAYSVTMRNFAILTSVMAADFFPRLSALINDRHNLNKSVVEQNELLLLCVSSVALLLIVFAPLIITVLFDDSFSAISVMIRLFAYSFVFRCIWATLSFIPLAYGDKYNYLKYDAIIGNGFYFLANVIAYYYWGLTGLAWSGVVGCLGVACILYYAYSRRYEFAFTSEFKSLFLKDLLLMSLLLAANICLTDTYLYVADVAILIIYIPFLFREIDRRVSIMSWVNSKIKKNVLR